MRPGSDISTISITRIRALCRDAASRAVETKVSTLELGNRDDVGLGVGELSNADTLTRPVERRVDHAAPKRPVELQRRVEVVDLKA